MLSYVNFYVHYDVHLCICIDLSQPECLIKTLRLAPQPVSPLIIYHVTNDSAGKCVMTIPVFMLLQFCVSATTATASVTLMEKL